MADAGSSCGGGSLVVYACAGKSISRTDGDNTSDDGVGGGQPGAGGSVGVGGNGGAPGRGGTAGVSSGGGGGNMAPTGGNGGFGARGGTSGRGGIGGTGGDAGETSAGASVGGSEDCEQRRSGGAMHAVCAVTSGCITNTNPTMEHIGRNQPTEAPGYGGEGGNGVDDSDYVASATVCSSESGNGFLAFDYFNPHQGVASPGFTLLSSGTLCGGYSILGGSFADYGLPPPGTWTTQCIEVTDEDSARTVTIDVYTPQSPRARVRNVRFVSSCACPRQVTRYTTCGNITSQRRCQ